MIHFIFRILVCAIKFFSQIRFSVCGGHEIFQRCHELFVSCVAQSLRKLHGVAEGFSLYHSFQQMEELFAVQRSFSGYRLLLNVFSPLFLDLLLGCSSTWRCAQEHFSQNRQPLSDLWNQHSGGCHFSQSELVQVPFEVNLAGPSRHSTTGTLPSGTSGSRRISLILPRKRTRVKEFGDGCVIFAHLLTS